MLGSIIYKILQGLPTYCILNRILLRYFLGSYKIFNTASYRISSQDVMEDSDKTALRKMVRHDEKKECIHSILDESTSPNDPGNSAQHQED